MTRKKRALKNTEPIYIPSDDEFAQATEAVAALDILHNELTQRDGILNKLKGMSIQVAGMGAANAKDIAEVKRVLAALEESGQIDIGEASDVADRDFVTWLDALPDADQEEVLDHIIEIARKSRTAEDFDRGISQSLPSLLAGDETPNEKFPSETDPDEALIARLDQEDAEAKAAALMDADG